MINYYQKINYIKKTNIPLNEKPISINEASINFKNNRCNNNDDLSKNKADPKENDELSEDFIETEKKVLIKLKKKQKVAL